MENFKKKIVCYGEVLWDLIKNGLRPAGAPLNVAYHFKKMNIQCYIISRVGADNMGKKILKIIKEWNINGTFCKKDKKFPTGKVIAKIDSFLQEVSYEVMEPVAWDFISVENEHFKKIKNTNGFVFQSLTARNKISRNTLYTLLKKRFYKIFDVNLRLPFYSEKIIKELFIKSNLIKMSLTELYEIVSWLQIGNHLEREVVFFFKKKNKLKELLITKGSNGASYYGFYKVYEKHGLPLKVKDTIGSGDAFLAGFLSEKIKGSSNEDALEHAVALGASTASIEANYKLIL